MIKHFLLSKVVAHHRSSKSSTLCTTSAPTYQAAKSRALSLATNDSSTRSTGHPPNRVDRFIGQAGACQFRKPAEKPEIGPKNGDDLKSAAFHQRAKPETRAGILRGLSQTPGSMKGRHVLGCLGSRRCFRRNGVWAICSTGATCCRGPGHLPGRVIGGRWKGISERLRGLSRRTLLSGTSPRGASLGTRGLECFPSGRFSKVTRTR